jgi:hypothetical protein
VALSRRLDPDRMAPLGVPVLMALASRDATVVPASAVRLFCRAAPPGRRKLLWYTLHRTVEEARSDLKDLGADEACLADIEVRDRAATGAPANILEFSHLSLPNRPDNPVYGAGHYRNCLSYYFADRALYDLCKERPPAEVVMGERGDTAGQAPVQRLTFNPDFDAMAERIGTFLAGTR